MRLVIALGGNALQQRGEPLEASKMLDNASAAMEHVAEASEHELLVVHGNGPQVGLLALQNAAYKGVSPYPLHVLDAETEGMIGYPLMQAFTNASGGKRAVTLLTQTVVDAGDPAFKNPTKFVGPIYTESEKAEMEKQFPKWVFKRDGDSFRRTVPSPKPKRIVELDAAISLLEQGYMVVAGGGGGIPCLEEAGQLHGVDAVVDKDRTAALIAKSINADRLIILTDVEAVYIGFGKPDAKKLGNVTIQELEKNEYPAGSMGPKVGACVDFVQSTGKRAAIGSLYHLDEILRGTSGTHILP